MRKCHIEMLGVIATTRCNLNCAHCLHGKKDNTDISNEVIESIFDKVASIGTLTICGGENTLALDRLEYIIEYIISTKKLIGELTITINGSIYSEELLRLLKYINDYIHDPVVRAHIGISFDEYHLKELKRLSLHKEYLENIEKYMESEFFYSLRPITNKLFREGNAENIPLKKTVPLRPPKKFLTYIDKHSKFDENGACLIGPVVSVNTKGIITECDASEIHQETIYNYGSILNTTFEKSALENDAKILKPKKYLKAINKEWKAYTTYKK